MTNATAEPEVLTQEEVPNTAGGDADLLTPADAAGPSQDASTEPPADYTAEAEEAFKAELEGKEGEKKAPEPERRPAVDPALVENARNELRNNHRARQDAIDSYEDELEEALVPTALRKRLLKELKDKLTEEHADGLRLAGFEAYKIGQAQEKEIIRGLIDAGMPAASKKAFQARLDAIAKENEGIMPYKDIFAAQYTQGDEDGFSRGKKDGFLAGFKAGRAKADKDAATGQSGQSVNGSVPASQSEDAELLNPNTPLERVQAILAKRR